VDPNFDHLEIDMRRSGLLVTATSYSASSAVKRWVPFADIPSWYVI